MKWPRQSILFFSLLAVSFVVAFVAFIAPATRMPVDFERMFHVSFPLAGVWAVAVLFALFYFRRKALWFLFGGPVALYWPVWFFLNGLPECYFHHNCV